jgi:hypothetical protein
MILGRLFTGILARPWALRAAAISFVALSIFLLLFNLRRTAESAARASERLKNMERANALQRQMLNAAGRRPRGRDDLIERLRKVGF